MRKQNKSQDEITQIKTLEQHLGFPLDDSDVNQEINLAELTPAEIEQLNQTITKLASFTISKPSQVSTDNLVQSLKQYLPHTKNQFDTPIEVSAITQRVIGLLQLLRPQISIFAAPFWFISALTMVLGVYLNTQTMNQSEFIPLLMIAPLVIALGIVYAFRNVDERIVELEKTAALSWIQLVLARMVIILGYNNIIVLFLSLIIHFSLPQLPLFNLLISWFAPLALWSSIALAGTLKFGQWYGVGGSLAIWAFQFVLYTPFPQFSLFTIAVTTWEITFRIIILVIAVLLTGYTILTSQNKNDWLKV